MLEARRAALALFVAKVDIWTFLFLIFYGLFACCCACVLLLTYRRVVVRVLLLACGALRACCCAARSNPECVRQLLLRYAADNKFLTGSNILLYTGKFIETHACSIFREKMSCESSQHAHSVRVRSWRVGIVGMAAVALQAN